MAFVRGQQPNSGCSPCTLPHRFVPEVRSTLPFAATRAIVRAKGERMHSEILLTMEEAKDAMYLDLEHYGIQRDTLEEIADMAGGGWPDRFREVMDAEEPGLYDIVTLVREFLNSPIISEEVLFGSFSMMFWSQARKADDEHGEEGVALTTELHDFSCLHCGNCCTNLDYSRALTSEDIAMWKHAGRDDILAWVGKDKEDGGYVIWVNPDTGETQEPCPFLANENGNHACSIHALKPTICREYPATKKHGFMTDCAGVALMVERECAG
jgi:Fe-S-cluster containining protein